MPALNPRPVKHFEHTAADAIAWAELQFRNGPRFGPALWTRSLMQDQRDAELMYQAQLARDRTFPVDLPPLSLIVPRGEIACGGAMWDRNPVWRHRHST